jgi:DNA-binding transcriptional regulator YhcF (GntR family)
VRPEMEYKNTLPIYLQIGDFVYENILTKRWKEGDKIPSVRELAIEAEVNPNTVMKTYTHLQNLGIIFNQRGIGYYISREAYQKARQFKKDDFVKNKLPPIFRMMELLQLDLDNFKQYFQEYKATNKQKEEKQEEK